MQSSNLINELSQNFIEYATAVNTDRSIPDAKCGLKPVARRILYGALHNGYTSGKAHVKCAKIVGDVMGQLHPHGDSSIYGALVRLAQPWVMRYPLIDFHGNMGNIGGDGPAAYRYTEARLSKFSEEAMLAGLKKGNVDFVPNYDETMEEPVTLPAVFPNLLCNPNAGIGVAMSCAWAPHNLNEVAQAINDYLDGKEPMLPGPDFPTGGVIINGDEVPNIVKTGHGTVRIRGQYTVKGKDIIFNEVPYGVSTEALINEIGEVCEKEEIKGVKEVRNESSKKNGLRIVIECQRDVEPGYVVQQLFAKTDLQSTFSYNQIALIDKVPTDMPLKKCIEVYVNHNIDCIQREARFDKAKAAARKEIVEGLLKALENIDNIIALIKGSASSEQAKTNLIATYGFTEPQAKAILDMKLAKLAKLEAIELNKENEELAKTIEELEALLSSEDRQIALLREKLRDVCSKYGDARRTKIEQIAPVDKEKADIPVEDVVVLFEGNGAKRVSKDTYKVQNRNTKGIKSTNNTKQVLATNTLDTLLLFSNIGKMYKYPVFNVPIDKNKPLEALIKLEPNEKITQITSMDSEEHKYIVFVTRLGLIKKTALTEYSGSKRATGCKVIELNQGDSLVDAKLVPQDMDIIVATKNGKTIHFTTSEVSPTGKTSKGVLAIRLDEGDEVVDFTITKPGDQILVISHDGKGKKVDVKEFPRQGRAGKGVMAVDKGQALSSILALDSGTTSVMLFSPINSIRINTNDIPLSSRTAQGNILLKGSDVKAILC